MPSSHFLDGKTILVTGGTGSFGQQFVDTVLRLSQPEAIRIYSRDELKQQQMQRRVPDQRLRFLIGDVRDKERLYRAMRGVEIVVHAAALKQVPACEYNPFEAVKTNVLGAANVIDAAIDCSVDRVLAISTDKAVNPINLYGATKLCAEKLFIQGNAYSRERRKRFSCARYGNVVASRGSVVPLFLQQRSNGRITVTDRRMARFWMTLEQGVAFVLRCLDLMHGGEIFVPKIPSMSIMDLANVIAPGCRITFTGIRPGEKLHELLISPDEAQHTRAFPDMFVIQPAHPWWTTGRWRGGTSLPEGFSYSSATAPRLSVEELGRIVARLEQQSAIPVVPDGDDGDTAPLTPPQPRARPRRTRVLVKHG
ncbi:MAG: UDP-N-acetylglucosamine 4,6-dehydratase (inverting) [Candidatus Omnitrophica bacterium]|nr:UDP-N-acetylglucosamine 4,6-dehydratase (inverting) [Candidatus Omnitrophota bacterium]